MLIATAKFEDYDDDVKERCRNINVYDSNKEKKDDERKSINIEVKDYNYVLIIVKKKRKKHINKRVKH